MWLLQRQGYPGPVVAAEETAGGESMSPTAMAGDSPGCLLAASLVTRYTSYLPCSVLIALCEQRPPDCNSWLPSRSPNLVCRCCYG